MTVPPRFASARVSARRERLGPSAVSKAAALTSFRSQGRCGTLSQRVFTSRLCNSHSLVIHPTGKSHPRERIVRGLKRRRRLAGYNSRNSFSPSPNVETLSRQRIEQTNIERNSDEVSHRHVLGQSALSPGGQPVRLHSICPFAWTRNEQRRSDPSRLIHMCGRYDLSQRVTGSVSDVD